MSGFNEFKLANCLSLLKKSDHSAMEFTPALIKFEFCGQAYLTGQANLQGFS